MRSVNRGGDAFGSPVAAGDPASPKSYSRSCVETHTALYWAQPVPGLAPSAFVGSSQWCGSLAPGRVLGTYLMREAIVRGHQQVISG